MERFAAPEAIRILRGPAEAALVDVREHSEYGDCHPFLAVKIPYSRPEIDAPRLVSRRSTQAILCNRKDRVAVHATARL